VAPALAPPATVAPDATIPVPATPVVTPVTPVAVQPAKGSGFRYAAILLLPLLMLLFIGFLSNAFTRPLVARATRTHKR
jgi:hypothetical protein